MNTKTIIFATQPAFREWLERNHAKLDAQVVRFFKKGSGKPSMTWPESVDVALCFGWIDGVRKAIDELSYTIRFSPRRPGSIWSSVNIERAQQLIEQGLMHAMGLKAFDARKENKSRVYSYEQGNVELDESHRRLLKKNPAAWRFLQDQPPYYRRVITWWVVSAKKEETRLKRLEKLVAFSAKGQRLPEFTLKKASDS